MTTGRINQIAKQDSSETSTPLAYTIHCMNNGGSIVPRSHPKSESRTEWGSSTKSFIAIDIFQTLVDQLPLFFHITD